MRIIVVICLVLTRLLAGCQAVPAAVPTSTVPPPTAAPVFPVRRRPPTATSTPVAERCWRSLGQIESLTLDEMEALPITRTMLV